MRASSRRRAGRFCNPAYHRQGRTRFVAARAAKHDQCATHKRRHARPRGTEQRAQQLICDAKALGIAHEFPQRPLVGSERISQRSAPDPWATGKFGAPPVKLSQEMDAMELPWHR